MKRRALAAAVAAVSSAFCVAAVGGCVSDVAIGFDRAAGSGGSSAAGGGAGGSTSAGAGGDAGISGGSTSGGFAGPNAGGNAGEPAGGAGAPDCAPAVCGNAAEPYACGNCIDDDGDGKIDAEDSQCLGPCDDTEDSYYPSIPGQNIGSCRQDCYFDSGSGANDQCFSSFRCDPHSVAPAYDPSGDDKCEYDPTANISGTNASCEELRADQSDMCGTSCGPLVPNGCDCFGCCELPAKSGKFVWIGSTVNGEGSCNEASVDDPSACKPCEQMPSCANPCDECEICAGRPTPGDGCGGGDSQQCPTGKTACGLPGQAPCVPGEYCITGCCQLEPR